MMHEFDIDTDEMGTLVFCINQNKWRGGDDYESDGLVNNGNDMYSFKNGELWKHNVSGSNNNFYGVPVVSRIAVVSIGGGIRTWQTVSLEGNKAPTNATFKTLLPKVQDTRLVGTKFKAKEGVFYADLLRAGIGAALITGPRMRGPFIFALFEFDTTELLQIKYINIGYRLSAGHEFV